MVTRSLLYILPLPLFVFLIGAERPEFGILATGVALVYYLNLENKNKKFLLPISVLTLLIPISGYVNENFAQTLSIPYLVTIVAHFPTLAVVILFFLRTKGTDQSKIEKSLAPIGILIFGLLTVNFNREPYFYVGLITLGIFYFIKKTLTSKDSNFFRNWTLLLFSCGSIFMVLYSVVINEQLRETQNFLDQQMDDCYDLKNETEEIRAEAALLEAQLKLCEQENE